MRYCVVRQELQGNFVEFLYMLYNESIFLNLLFSLFHFWRDNHWLSSVIYQLWYRPCWIKSIQHKVSILLICTIGELHCWRGAHVVSHRWWTTLLSHVHWSNVVAMVFCNYILRCNDNVVIWLSDVGIKALLK